jgi:hypothetical protein
VPTSLDDTSYEINCQQIIRMAHFNVEYRLTGTEGWYWFHKTRSIKKNSEDKEAFKQ